MSLARPMGPPPADTTQGGAADAEGAADDEWAQQWAREMGFGD